MKKLKRDKNALCSYATALFVETMHAQPLGKHSRLFTVLVRNVF